MGIYLLHIGLADMVLEVLRDDDLWLRVQFPAFPCHVVASVVEEEQASTRVLCCQEMLSRGFSAEEVAPPFRDIPAMDGVGEHTALWIACQVCGVDGAIT